MTFKICVFLVVIPGYFLSNFLRVETHYLFRDETPAWLGHCVLTMAAGEAVAIMLQKIEHNEKHKIDGLRRTTLLLWIWF